MKFEAGPKNEDNGYKAEFFSKNKFKEKASFLKTTGFLILLSILSLSESAFAQKRTNSSEMNKLKTECKKNESEIKKFLEENGKSTARLNLLLNTSWQTKKMEFKDGTSIETGTSFLRGEKQNEFLVYFSQNADTAYFDTQLDGTVDRLIINNNDINIENKKKEALYIASGIAREQDNVCAYFFDENNSQKVQYADLKEEDFSFIEGAEAEKTVNLTQEEFSKLIKETTDKLK